VLLPGYTLRAGSGLDRALLVKFMQRTYQELYPEHDFSHLALTVEQYFSSKTPLWWVDLKDEADSAFYPPPFTRHPSPVGCLWAGNAIDQVSGNRHAHIFLVYVVPEHRRRGIGEALVSHAEAWAKERGDHQIALQVFVQNQPALNLYQKLGYQTQSLWMLKLLQPNQE
jgi:ribosomal protein S18 acetylase RimI-like enzyme